MWLHPYLRALQPMHDVPNSSTMQSLFPHLHLSQADTKMRILMTRSYDLLPLACLGATGDDDGWYSSLSSIARNFGEGGMTTSTF